LQHIFQYVKQFLAALLLFSIVCQVFSTSLLVVGFEVNQKYIVEHLCVNKDKPMMHCNGHCHLQKRLNDDEKNQNATPVNAKESFEISYCNTIEETTFFNQTLIGVVNTFYNQSLLSPAMDSIFHPPSC
jgi:hypothetical protein